MEVIVAGVVLTVGLMSAALLSTKLMTGSRQSTYMSLSATLASEKLEDLNRFDGAQEPFVCVQTGDATEGSLTADILQTTTCPTGTSDSVNYYDDVSIDLTNGTGNCANPTYGCLAETVSSVVAGVTKYTTTYHSPDGQILTTTTTTAPTLSTFHRRWIIEANQPVAGVRRVTVLVTCQDPTVRPAVTFQMSMVRP